MKLSRRSFALAAVAAPMLSLSNASGQRATPASTEFDSASSRIGEFLRFAPERMPDADLQIIWNDYERQFAAFRSAHPDTPEAATGLDILRATHIASGPAFIEHANILEDFAGYPIDDVLESVEAGVPWQNSIIVRLGIEAESLIPFWESMDYEEKENEFGRYWTIGEESEVNVTHLVNRAVVGRFNNIAILDESTIAYSPYADYLAGVQRTAMGDAPNMVGEIEQIAAEIPDDTTSLWCFEGDRLWGGDLSGQLLLDPDMDLEDVQASIDVLSEMPPILTACIGITANASSEESLNDPDSREFMLLEMYDSATAERAAEVITERVETLNSIETGQPYRDLLPGLEATVLESGLVLCSRTLDQAPPRFREMIYTRDILPFAF